MAGVAWYLVVREKNRAIENCDTCRLSSDLVKTSPSVTTQTPDNNQTPPDDLKYNNSDYGFSIDLTEVWRDCRIQEEDAEGAIKKVVFYFKTADKNYENTVFLAPALTVYIYNKADWEKIDPDTRSSTEIITSAKYAFTYSIWEKTPQDLEQITEKELADVIKTFKLSD